MSWNIAFISVHSQFVESYFSFGVYKAAAAAKKAIFSTVDLRDFACDKHGTVDGAPYGGGDGMIMRADCLEGAVTSILQSWGAAARIVFTTPGAKLWTQDDAAEFAQSQEPTVFICGRFGGVDQRFVDTFVTHQYSVGDFVVAGGELPALMMVETALRFIPGVLGNTESSACDSFGAGVNGLLEAPSFTRPQSWNGADVPSVLLSGDHEQIKKWRIAQSVARTKKLRPDLMDKVK